MSNHTLKNKRRHPKAPREAFNVGHITFEIDPIAKTFALIPGEADCPKERRPLFTGFIDKGMGTQMRRLAHRFDDLEG